ncbi:MAG: hypothetical protein ABI273_10985 [Lacunisphaera sp.]
MITQQPSSSGKRLIAYFYSGWAFFIPYLLTYLLYHWRKWPANSFAPSALGNGGHIPALLHVYWALHAIHLVLAIIALRTWWKRNPSADFNSAAPSGNVRKSRFDPYPLLPWIFLALIFAIPGVYLEWPSDPWEHLRRITEWSIHPLVGDHSAGYKSFYFFAYSFISVPPNLSRLGNVNIYGTCIDLLLAWQYYRLGKAVGLNQKWSFLFVLVNALTFGNVCFSFYKYYTLATTMYAQLGAVALTRITIDFFQESKSKDSNGFNLLRLPRLLAKYIVCLVLLLAFVACNHVQGLGIAGLGIGSIIVWRLLDWKRSAGWWLAAAAVILSVATILWWPRHPAIDSFYLPAGWLNFWYGFNLFAWPSPAADRAMQILGIFGLFNLGTGLLLLRRNQLGAWLAVGPVLALMIPVIALPFANTLAASDPLEIITFHRMLFAIPSGLVFVCWINQKNAAKAQSINHLRERNLCASLAIAFITGLVLTPKSISNSRLWNAISVTPQDLQLKAVTSAAISTAEWLAGHKNHNPVTTRAIASVFNTMYPQYFPESARVTDEPAAESLNNFIGTVDLNGPAALIRERQSLLDVSSMAKSSVWTTLGGAPPEFVEFTDYPAIRRAIQNPAGHSSEVFTSKLVPIEQTKNYVLEITARQHSGPNAIVFFAVAWYDEKLHELISNISVPNGAGRPPGWNNGTYSYFELPLPTIPTNWTTFRKSFGSDIFGSIPSNAKYIRVGALLNYGSTADASIQITNFQLREKLDGDFAADGMYSSYKQFFIFVPKDRLTSTPTSQAAQSSGHWPAQQVATILSGNGEMVASAHSIGSTPADRSSPIWIPKK